MLMFNKLFKSRKFKYGSVATIMTVIFIAAVVVFNIVAIMLVDRLPVKVDLTDNQIFDISDETEEFLDDITEKITIVITAEEAKFAASTGVYTQHLNEIIKNFAIHGKDISVKYVDLLQNPDFVADYEGTISEGQIIVESAKRYRVMAISEMFNITYNNYGQMQSIDSSKAEQELVSALMYVTDQSPETVQILGGREELELAYLESLLSKNSYVVTDIDIISEELDPEANFAMLVAPRYDYTDAMIDKLDTWLDNGGKFGKTLIYVANADQPDLPMLDAYLEEWGIDIGYEVIAETNTSNSYGSVYYNLHQISGKLYTQDLKTAKNPVMVANSRPVNVLWAGKGIREVEVLVSTYDSATLRPTDADEDWTTADATTTGSYGTVVLSRKLYLESEPHTQSNIIAVGSAYFFDEYFLSMPGVNNADYTISLFNGIAGREGGIVIAPKSLEASMLSLSEGQADTLSWVFVIIVPAAVIITGVVTWVRRRHR